MAPWLLLGLLFLLGCSDNSKQDVEVHQSEEKTEPSPAQNVVQIPSQAKDRVATALVAEQLLPQTVTAPGEVALDLARVAKISSRIEGQVEQMFVELGDKVKRGQPLLAVGSLKLDELIQEFLVSRVQANVTKSNFLRTRKLLDEQVVSQRRFLEDQGKYLQAKAVHQHVTEKLQNMGLTRSELEELIQGKHIEGHHYLLKTPLSGVVSSQKVVLGQGVIPGDELLQIIDISEVWVFANLPVEQVRRFKVGDRGVIAPKGRASIEAVLGYIAPIADKATLTVRLRFDVENKEGVLKPNEYVEVRLMEEAAVTMTIPRSAVTMIDGVQGAFVQGEDGFVFVPIKVGREGDDWVEVVDGLTTGQHVVIKGVFDLKNALLKDSIQGE